jgi:hypothetical protein
MMRGSFSKAARSLMFLLLAPTVQAQVSFFQPPTYVGHGDVFVADFNGDGKPDLLSADGTVELGNGDGTFKLGTSLSGGVVAVADFNGDGKADVLQQGTGTLLVLLGNGDGTFKPAISTPSGASLTANAAIDLNGDGKADVVGVFNDTLIVYLSEGDGTFAPGVSYNIGAISAGVTVLTLGDFNGDNKTDVVLSIAGNNVAGQEIVFLGNGDGSFQAAKAFPSVYYPSSAAVGDFNGDGKLDIAVSSPTYANGSTRIPGSVYILLGNGDGSFQSPTPAFTGDGPLVAADLNADGKLDLVFENDYAVCQVYLGKGDGTFSNTSDYILSLGPSGSNIVAADFNLDGKLDFAMSGSVLLSNGNGTFQGVQFGVIPDVPWVAVTGAFGKNAPPGVAVLSNPQTGSGLNVYVLTNNGGGDLVLSHTYTLQRTAYGIAKGDFNGDGNLDLLIVSTDPLTQQWSYSILLGNADGSFQSPSYYPLSVAAGRVDGYSIVVGDFNNDGKLDAAISMANNTLALLMGNGDGTFAAPVYVYDGGATVLVSADFNGDGKLDIAAGGTNPKGLPPPATALLLGNGDGTFQAAIFPANLGNFFAEFTADLDNDGRPDLVSGVQVALGNGDGTFRLLPAISQLLGFGFAIAIADLDGDGKSDLLVAVRSHIGQTDILLGNGDGTFGSDIPVLSGGSIQSPLVADMNGDGRPDIIFLWQSDQNGSGNGLVNGIGVLLNNTAPGFRLSAATLSPATVPPGSSATSTINITRTLGFRGAVALSCVGLPSGANCQFNPPSIPDGSSTSSLVITTTTGTAAGTYPVQVEGSAGSLTNSAALSLVVQAPPDFTIAGSPASQTVSAGQSATFSLSVTPTGSFGGAVNLSCRITPTVTPAPTCTLSSSSMQINGNGAGSVTLTVGTTAPVTTGMRPRVDLPPVSIPLTWAVMLLVLEWLWVRNPKRRPILAPHLVVLVALALSSGCGGGSSNSSIPGTPAGTYTTTVTATSGSLTHNTALQVVVR